MWCYPMISVYFVSLFRVTISCQSELTFLSMLLMSLVVSLLLASAGALSSKYLSRMLFRPSTRPPTSTRLTEWPKRSTVRLTEAARGTKESGENTMLDSAEAPELKSSEK